MKVKHPPSVEAYFSRIGAEVLNFRRAMIKVNIGAYYKEKALIKIRDDGTVECSMSEYAPTEAEAAVMKAELSGIDFPRGIKARSIEGLREAGARGELFEFIDRRTNEIIMVQERIEEDEAGGKRFIPWIMLSNGEWAALEPDGKLPFWKPRGEIKPGGKIMIHEGAKAARAADRIVREKDVSHPWFEELSEYIHFGMIGGALAPHRTDYRELEVERPKEVVYVCDNDKAGVAAIKEVSRCWGKGLKQVRFGDKFPNAFDMADPIPETLMSGEGRYVGPKLGELMGPATWATVVVPPPSGKKGKGTIELVDEFRDEWFAIIRPQVFIHRDWPSRIYTLPEFDQLVAPFSHSATTSTLLKKEIVGQAAALKYTPAEKPGIYSGASEGTYINTYEPSRIKPEAGDPGPWVEFLERLIPTEKDRTKLERWIATFVARPDIRINYGVLMVSEMQGVGKSTLADCVLAPLAGNNVSWPSEQEIADSNFNDWLAHKRLAIIQEIYSGHSSKAYNKLKDVITDPDKTINKKYQTPYKVEIWVHVFACSNSMRALKLDNTDRRWLIPKVTEKRSPAAFFESFRYWLKYKGGLSIISWWCHEYVKKHGSIGPGENAPDTDMKQAMIMEGYSPGMNEAAKKLEEFRLAIEEGIWRNQDTFEDSTDNNGNWRRNGATREDGWKHFVLRPDAFTTDTSLQEVVRYKLYEGRYNEKLERALTMRSVAKHAGFAVGETRVAVKEWRPEFQGGRVITLCAETAGKTPGQLDKEGRKPVNLNELSVM